MVTKTSPKQSRGRGISTALQTTIPIVSEWRQLGQTNSGSGRELENERKSMAQRGKWRDCADLQKGHLWVTMCQAFSKTLYLYYNTKLAHTAGDCCRGYSNVNILHDKQPKKFYVSKLEQTTNLNLVAKRQRITAKTSPKPQEYFIFDQKSTCRWRHVGEETWVLMWPLLHKSGIEVRQICVSAGFETLGLLHLHIPWRKRGGPEIN